MATKRMDILSELHAVSLTNKMLNALKLMSFQGLQIEKLFIKELLASLSTLEKVSAAKEEVKETFGYGKQDSEGSNVNSDSCSSNTKDTNHSTGGEKQQQHQKPDFQHCS
nr:mitochondrial import inner membrane translocase subunit TIM44-2-like isoform X3 [Ipomoea trifida]GMD69352.1 mitochondrial import inner membrane translocase subunit TIM44-2-like [Ipomoea batatas]